MFYNIIIFAIIYITAIAVTVTVVLVNKKDNTNVNDIIEENNIYRIVLENNSTLSEEKAIEFINKTNDYIIGIIDQTQVPIENQKIIKVVLNNSDSLGGGTSTSSGPEDYLINLNIGRENNYNDVVKFNNINISYITFILNHEIIHVLTFEKSNIYIDNLTKGINNDPPNVYIGVSGVAGYKEVLTTSGYDISNLQNYIPLNTRQLPIGNLNNRFHFMEYEARLIDDVLYPTFEGILMSPIYSKTGLIDNFSTPILKGLLKDLGWPVIEDSEYFWTQPVPYRTNINALWVAGGTSSNNTLIYSKTGEEWFNAEGDFMELEVYDISCRNSYGVSDFWVAVGESADNYKKIVYSDNGISWYKSSGASFGSNETPLAVQNTDDFWVALGQYKRLYSYDGKFWEEGTGGPIINNFANINTNGTSWLASGSGAALISANGIDWEGLKSSVANPYYLGSYYARINNTDFWYVVLRTTFVTPEIKILYSTDLETWGVCTGSSFLTTDITKVSFSKGKDIGLNDKLALVKENKILYSNDGINWIESGISITGDITDISFGYKYAFGGTSWLATTSNKIYDINDLQLQGEIKDTSNLLTSLNKITYNYTEEYLNTL